MKNKVITSQGNVQFVFPDGKIVNVHPNHIYTVFNEDTVSFILVALPKSSGLALMTSKAEDLELNGETYAFEDLSDAINEAFSIAGAQARAEIVDELPETGYTNTIYLVPQAAPQTGYDEYIYVRDRGWELIGDTSIEMENYVMKSVFSGYTADTAVVLDGLRTDVDAKTVTVSITQSAYDALPSSAKTDATKLYVISDALPIDLSVYAKVSALTAEESARIAADSALTNAITAEENRAKAVESGLSESIDAEETRALGAESDLEDAISAETSAREAADSFISGAVDTLSTALANEVQRAQNAESGLSEDIEDEMTRAMVIEDALQDAIDAVSGDVISETSRAEAAESDLDDKIGVVSGNVETETARAEGVENVLSGAIDTIDAKFIDDAKYEDSGNTKVINFYNGNTIKATIDCSDFIVDGMVDDVRIENGYLVIDFNTESGKQDIQIPLTDIFNPSNYYTKSETSGATEIATAMALKLDASAYTVDSSVIENSVNPVQGGALYDELRIEGEPSETTLQWDNHDGGETTNYPNGVSTIKIEVVDGSEGGGNGYSFFDENHEQLGYITVLYNDGDVTVDSYENVTYSISSNVVTVNYPTIAANVTIIGSSYDNIYTIKAIGESSVISVKDQVTANTAAIYTKQPMLQAGENITISGNVISATGGGVNVVQTTGTSTIDVMSQDAVTTQLNDKANKTTAARGLSHGSKNTHSVMHLINQNDREITGYYYTLSLSKINGKDIVAQGDFNPNTFSLVEASAITTSVTSASTDSQVPSAKAVYDAIQEGGGGGTVESAITSGSTNAVAGGAVFDAVVYSGNTYNTELTFDANGYAENWVVGQSAITIDVSGYTSDTRAVYHFENSNGEDLGRAHIFKVIGSWGGQWSNDAVNCTITTDGDTATTATITNIPSGTVKVRRTDERNSPKAIISGDTPETWIKDVLDEHRDNTTIHITAAERTYWNNKSNFSGSYNDLTDKPIPDSALNVASTNPVQNQALFSELRIDGEGEAETTLAFEGDYSTNYPNGCTKIKVEGIISNSMNNIHFIGDDGGEFGNITINNWGSITVDNYFDGATYEISGTTVIISYPTVTTVARLNIGDNAKYTYKAITSSTTPLKDQVVANTTALGGLKLQQISQSDYDNLPTKDNNTLYVII